MGYETNEIYKLYNLDGSVIYHYVCLYKQQNSKLYKMGIGALYELWAHPPLRTTHFALRI